MSRLTWSVSHTPKPATPMITVRQRRGHRTIGCRPLPTRTGRRGEGTGRGNGSVEIVAQDLGTRRVAQLGHRLGLDLPDPFPGHPVDLPDLVQGARLAVGPPEAQPHHARLALRP